MSNATWKWADLSREQQQQLVQAETALNADYLLAFAPASTPGEAGHEPVRGITAAPLTDSQLECLNGLESQLHTVIVAYRKGGA